MEVIEVKPQQEKKLPPRRIRETLSLVERLFPLLSPVRRFEVWAPSRPESEKAPVYPGKRTLYQLISAIVSAYILEDPYMLFLGTIPQKAVVFSRDIADLPPTCKVEGVDGLLYSVYIFSSEIEASKTLIERRYGSVMDVIPITVKRVSEFSGKVYTLEQFLSPSREEEPEVVEVDFEEEASTEENAELSAPSTFREARSFKDPRALLEALLSLELKGDFQALVAEKFPSQVKKDLFPLQDAIAFPLKTFPEAELANVLLLYYPASSRNVLRPAKARLITYSAGFYMPTQPLFEGEKVTVVVDSVLGAALAQEAVARSSCQAFSISIIGVPEPKQLLIFREKKEVFESSLFVFFLVDKGKEVLGKLRGLQQGKLRGKIKVTSKQLYYENFLTDPCITLASLLS